MHILIVEDHPLFGSMLARTVRRLAPGATVAHVTSLHDALARQPAPVLVLLDLHLPDCDDDSGLARLRARYPEATIALVTGDDRIGVADGLRAGAHFVLLKGWDIEAFGRDLAAVVAATTKL